MRDLLLLPAGFTVLGCHQPEKVVAPKGHQPTFHLSPAVRERRGSMVSAALSLSRRSRTAGRWVLPTADFFPISGKGVRTFLP